MTPPKLEQLIDNAPSAIRSSISIRIVKLIAWILGFGFLLLGVGFVLNSFVQYQLIDWLMVDEVFRIEKMQETQAIRIMQILGVLFIVLGGIFFYMVKLSKRILIRNKFIFNLQMQLEETRQEQSKSQ